MKRLLRTILLGIAATFIITAGTKHSSKPVHVRQYTRKDGTVVRAHDRTLPGTADHGKPLHVRQDTREERTVSVAPIPMSTPKSTAGSRVKRDSGGRISRSTSAKRAFESSHPCPATGSTTGPCEGYVIDHIKPLACGGADDPRNMQWQIEAAAKAKDRTERIGCTPR